MSTQICTNWKASSPCKDKLNKKKKKKTHCVGYQPEVLWLQRKSSYATQKEIIFTTANNIILEIIL